MSEQRFPIANDIDGNPLDVPEAVAWRVRPHGGGRSHSVFHPATAIDEDGSVIENVIAYTEVRDVGESAA